MVNGLFFVFGLTFRLTDVVSLTDCPHSEFILESYLKDPRRMRSNTTITGDHEKTVFLDAILPSLSQDPDHLSKQVADTNDSAQWKIYVRRLHHRVREGE